MKPSEEYELCIPEDKSQTAIAMEAVDPSVYVSHNCWSLVMLLPWKQWIPVSM